MTAAVRRCRPARRRGPLAFVRIFGAATRSCPPRAHPRLPRVLCFRGPRGTPLGGRSRCQQPARPGRIREIGVKPGSDRSAGMMADPGRHARASGAPTGPVPASGVRSLNSDRDVIRRYGATALDLFADLLPKEARKPTLRAEFRQFPTLIDKPVPDKRSFLALILRSPRCSF